MRRLLGLKKGPSLYTSPPRPRVGFFRQRRGSTTRQGRAGPAGEGLEERVGGVVDGVAVDVEVSAGDRFLRRRETFGVPQPPPIATPPPKSRH